MSKQTNKDIFGRFIVAAFVAFFIFKYHYEVSQFIHSGSDFILSIRDSITTYLERTFDDSGILLALVLLIVLIIWTIIQLIIVVVGAIIVWVVVTLNDAYILPFLIPLMIVYSNFSYSFIVKPILWLPKNVFILLGKFGRFLQRTFNLFIVLPIAEVISLKNSPRNNFYKILTSLLFVFGFLGVIIGGTGVAIKIMQDGDFVVGIESKIKKKLSAVFEKSSYTYIQHQAILKASTPNWTQTTIQLKKGDVVEFTATGKVRCISPFKGGNSITNPMGIYLFTGYVRPSRLTRTYRQKGFSPSYYILPDENINCLMAKVGIGEAFAIGSSETYKVKQDGLLFFGINQLWKSGAWRNNQGQLDINVEIKRKV